MDLISDNSPTSDGADKPWKDAALFKDLYIDKGKTLAELKELWGCSIPTLTNWAKKHGLAKRGKKAPKLYSRAPGEPVVSNVNVGRDGAAAEMMSILSTWDSLPPAARKPLREVLRKMIDQL